VERHGSRVLTLAVDHPGVALIFIERMGEQAIQSAQVLSTDQLMVLVGYIDLLESLAEDELKQFFDLVQDYPYDVIVALESRPGILLDRNRKPTVELLMTFIREGVAPPAAPGADSVSYLVNSLPCMGLVFSGVLLISWGLTGLIPAPKHPNSVPPNATNP
jgi:hypothetical protein